MKSYNPMDKNSRFPLFITVISEFLYSWTDIRANKLCE
jgi:hypothetical protein